MLEISEPQFSDTEPDFVLWQLSGSISMPGCFPGLDQSIGSLIYKLPTVLSLRQLLDGDSSARFTLDLLHFRLEIFEHTLGSGPRYGFVVVGNLHSANAGAEPGNWPGAIPDQLLRDPSGGELSIDFAFTVDRDAIHSFQKEFSDNLSRSSISGG